MNNPNCLQFIRTYKRLLLRHDVNLDGGNCVAQDQTEILSMTSSKRIVNITDVHFERLVEDAAVNKLQEEMNIALPLDLSEFAENAVTYIAGYVIKIIKRHWRCPQCIEALFASSTEDPADTSLKFINFKSRGLYYAVFFYKILFTNTFRRIKYPLEKLAKHLL